MAKILVLSGDSYISAIKGLGDICIDPNDFLKNPTDYKLVLFTGGEDITPELYNHSSPQHMCYNNVTRDKFEKIIFDCAVNNCIRMTGICRGIQFINVMAGGKMYHHVFSHAGSNHGMELPSGKILEVNSLHHQMVIPPDDGILAGWTPKAISKEYYGEGDLIVDGPYLEPESIIYPSIQSAGVQYHPEMMSATSDGGRYFYGMAKSLIETKNFSDVISEFMGET